jgi:hypothetical protein
MHLRARRRTVRDDRIDETCRGVRMMAGTQFPAAACAKCGLTAVRYELERHGVVLRFCDFCYWGELEADSCAAAAPDGGTDESPAVRDKSTP